MFAWLKNRRLKRLQAQAALAEAEAMRQREEARLIYSFFDGTSTRKADPMRIWREIMCDKEFNYQTMIEEANKGNTVETEICLNCLCRVFRVARYNETTHCGLTEMELLNLLDDFAEWMIGIQKKTPYGPTLQEPTGRPPSSSSPAAPLDPTKPYSDSGETASGQKLDSPTGASGPFEKLAATP